ncbi:C-C motif chemokine 19-like [Clupea harengus]|uniref:C-C motif chemokine 19-like n=1 Tax=Clupea harengus TaxID=7950 RepID=A0A6P8GWZ4_CLUHA|nr:C-C motif chemokine 19-like [Clupea harengus]
MRCTLVIVIMGALLVAVTGQGGRYRRPTRVRTECCTSVNRAVIPNIKAAKIQNALPPCVEAMVFTTVDGKQYCTDPKAAWVPKVLRGLNKTQ